MNYRPYPDVDRALAQLERRQKPHSPLTRIDEHLRLGLVQWQKDVVAAAVRKTGKSAITAAITDEAIKAGEHVHVATVRGVRCAGGDPTLPLPRIERGDQVVVEYDGHRVRYQVTDIPYRERPGSISITLRAEAPVVLARAVRTCTAVPSQWNAWTVTGQYLYLRYRSGIGTVDTYDSTDIETWTHVPDGQVAFFDTGDRRDGEMDLPEFCERTGLQLADDAEVIGE